MILDPNPLAFRYLARLFLLLVVGSNEIEVSKKKLLIFEV
jgi:hypothetical protein